MFKPITSEAISLIRHGHRYSPVFGPRLSNHLPMALIAMSRLGASSKDLHEEFQRATPHLEAEQAPVAPQALKLGEKTHNADFVLYYSKELETKGIEATLNEALPTLLPGIAAGSFHALIRLAYAVESEDFTEISHALAYWSSGFTPLGNLQYATDKDAVSHLNEALGVMRDHTYREGIIIDHVEELRELAKYRAVSTQPASLTKESVAIVVLSQYAASNDFTLLHGVTGFQALLSLAPFIDNFDFALDCFWQAYVGAACTAEYRDPVAPERRNIRPDWGLWFKQALATQDDHTIKLIYSCAQIYNELQLDEALFAINVRLGSVDLW
ncbi:questin oxidase family protein [Grimontia sp. SpTr1]|uniref:questin oxidase family protein n=1 Tax=Grimontia sp. SpTr1 TaxID=2995319 RepID=UPI00248C0FFB|nr:questin oxidase family protein [Grimontia sp. SpTr1]